MKEINAETLEQEMLPDLEKQVKRFSKIKEVMQPGEDAGFEKPPILMPEHAQLAPYVQADYAGLIVRSVSQSLQVSGIVGPNGTNAEDWKLWKECRLGQKENYIYDTSGTFGESYLKAIIKPNGRPDALFRSPFKTIAFFNDPVNDEYPCAVLEKDGDAFLAYDSSTVYRFEKSEEGSWEMVEEELHGFSEVPFVRFSSSLDSEGKTWGEVEKNIPQILKIQKIDWDSLINGHSSSHRIITANGIDIAGDVFIPDSATPEEAAFLVRQHAEREKLQLQVGGILIGDKETSFGVLPAADPGAFVAWIESEIQRLAALAELPVSFLSADQSAMSAEQASVSNKSWEMKLKDRQSRYGAAFEAFFRLLRQVTHPNDEPDFEAKFVWEMNDANSLAAVVDALVKEASLEVPKTELWDQIPNTTPEQRDRWKLVREQEKGIENAFRAALLDQSAGSGEYSPEELIDMEKELEAAETFNEAQG